MNHLVQQENQVKPRERCVSMESGPPETDLLTPTEAASYLRKPIGTLYNLVNRKEIPFLKAGGSLRFRRSELDAWLLDGAGRSTPEPRRRGIGGAVQRQPLP